VLLHAARKGEAEVFLNLGYAYDVGHGIRRCRRRALHWYRRALESDEASAGSAANNIGTIYRDRDDVLRAAKWFRRAVAAGNSASNLALGMLLVGRLGRPTEALACFRAVGPDASEASIEAATTWAAFAENLLATRNT